MPRPRVESWLEDPELLVMRREVRRAENASHTNPHSVRSLERYADRLSIYRDMLAEHLAKRRT